MTITFAELTAAIDLFDRADLLPRPDRLNLGHRSHHGQHHEDRIQEVNLIQRAAQVRLHPQLPATPVWTYNGMFPGPVLTTLSGTRIQVRHRNEIHGTMPYRHVVVKAAAAQPLPMNTPGGTTPPGTPDAAEAEAVSQLHAHTVVHLHGAPTGPDSDGWTDNMTDTTEEHLAEYCFDRETWPLQGADGTELELHGGAAPMFWYHDHAMGCTRFNVYAGLAGAWLVRDPIEHALGLPTDEEREIPLILSDRNLDTHDGTPDGMLTGALIHKVQTDVRECFSPVNLVNGRAWPRIEVSRQVYRLRLLCGANARTYRLHLLAHSGQEQIPLPSHMVQQIGTDGGLLGQAVNLPADGLILAPGERADLLVDMELAAAAGFTRITVVNNAPAPFQGAAPDETTSPGTPQDDAFLPIPQVMRFDITGRPGTSGCGGLPIEAMPLDPRFRRVPLAHAGLPRDHGHNVVALREEAELVRDETGAVVRDTSGAPRTMTMLYLHELQPESVADAAGCNLHRLTAPGLLPDGSMGEVPTGIRVTLPGMAEAYVSVGKRFRDTSMIQIPRHSWQLWKVINLSPDTYPFHIHLTQLQAVSRTALIPTEVRPGDAPEFEFIHTTAGILDENEQGWKDTFRVNPGARGSGDEVISAEMVTLLGNFSQHNGQYMYHCHILEHEDRDMMRPFDVLPAEIRAIHGGHHH